MNIVQDLTTKLQKKRMVSAMFVLLSVSISIAVLTGLFLSGSFLIQLGAGSLSFVIGLGILIQQGWFRKPSEIIITRFLDRNYPFVEESSVLFTRQPKTVFENWQLEKIKAQVEKNREQIRLPNRILKKSALISIALLLFTLLTGIITKYSSQNTPQYSTVQSSETETEPSEEKIPVIQHVEITVNPPRYTNLPERTEHLKNVTVAENAGLSWNVTTNGAADSVWVKFGDQSSEVLRPNEQVFEGRITAQNNQIYQIGASNSDTTIFTDYLAISVISDSPPQFLFDSPTEQRSMITEQNREVFVDVQMIDDYEITDASVQATLARGSGENVRFRERTLHFDNISGLNSPQARGRLTLNADSLDMQPGDELYFFAAATDNRPELQTGRSETYFIIYQDTSRAEQAPFGSIAVDLMPEYFRSQRQIIIDTETLLEEKASISEQEFNQRSNTIGQNQALLRLRYGEYLGLENESGGPTGDVSSGEIVDHQDEDHDHAAAERDINEQGLERSQSEAAANAPDEFMHDHGSAEMNTLYADSPRAMLKESVANMWDAERYLRTHRPETALAYEYRALELLKEVQQANRMYVRKVGYDLSPIPVDETRLSGTYDDFANPGEEFSADVEKSPLSKLQLMIREETLDQPGHIEQATKWVQSASIPDADRLYILNRLRRISEEGFTKELKENLLERMDGIQKIRQYNLVPSRRPSLGSLQENR